MIQQTNETTFTADNGRGTSWTLEHDGWGWTLYSSNRTTRAYHSCAMGKRVTLAELEQRKAWRGVSALVDESAVIAAAELARDARLAEQR